LFFANLGEDVMSKYSIDVDAREVTFEFGEGIGETTVFQLDSVTDEMIRLMLTLHGAKQKLVDGFADAASRPDGMTEEAYKAMQVEERIAMFQRGEWTLRGEGGTPRVSLVVRALAELMDKPEAEVAKLWAEADKKTKSTIRKHPRFKSIHERMKAEEALRRSEAAQDAAQDAPDVSELLS